jgi:microcystin-dependent protein
LRFRRIVAGDNINVSQGTEGILISAPTALKLATNNEILAGVATKAISPAGLNSIKSNLNMGDFIVERDYYGNFEANTIKATLNGNAATATKLVASRTIRLIGDITGSVTTDLSGDVTISTALYGIVPPGVPPGTIIMYAVNTAPMGYVPCNGGTYNRTGIYANLFAAIGTTYGAPSSTTFQVPDLRGYFVRGHGTNADGTASGSFGAKQTAYAGYNKYYTSQDDGDNQDNNTDRRGEVNYIAVNDIVVADGANANTRQRTKTTNVDTIAGDTRPKNIALLYCIRF